MSEAIDINLLTKAVNRILSRKYGRTVQVTIGCESEEHKLAAGAETDEGNESG